MTVTATPPLKLSDLVTEFGSDGSTSLKDYVRGGARVPDIAANAAVANTTGALKLSQFYGTQAMSPITIPSTWGSATGASPLVSVSRTLTVPAGNPGTIRFVIVSATGSAQYKKNGGANTNFTDGMTLAMANGDTLVFRTLGASADGLIVNIYDHTLNVLMGGWAGTIA